LTIEPENPLLAAYAQAEQLHVPLVTLVELTHACNVDCEHCYLDLAPDRKIGALSTEEWKRVFRELKDEGCLFLTLSGGELLLRRDWHELATYARKLGFALRLYTNGTLIDDAAADRIRDLKPRGVEISVLGGLAITHDAVVRRRGAFEKTLAGIRRLRERGVAVFLKCVVMDRNAGEVDALKELGRSLGCEVYFDLEVTPKNNGSEAPQDRARARDALLEAARRILGEPESFKLGSRDERLDAPPCGAGTRTCHIGPTGLVHPCTQWTVPVGNLREASFRSIWRGSPALDSMRRVRGRDLEPCSSCDLFDLCSPCMALSLLERGEVGGPSPTKCRSAELRAEALGRPGKSAWLSATVREGGGAVLGTLVALRRSADGPRLSR
jgi:radical SAM protein with 4Fe4S-binding SPASM domain